MSSRSRRPRLTKEALEAFARKWLERNPEPGPALVGEATGERLRELNGGELPAGVQVAAPRGVVEHAHEQLAAFGTCEQAVLAVDWARPGGDRTAIAIVGRDALTGRLELLTGPAGELDGAGLCEAIPEQFCDGLERCAPAGGPACPGYVAWRRTVRAPFEGSR